MKKTIFSYCFLSILLFHHSGVYSQCFASPGNPVAGSANLGVLKKHSARAILFFKNSQFSGYYEGDKKSDFKYISLAEYNYSGFVLGYGLGKKITTEAEVGYFINKTQHYDFLNLSLRGYGFSNAVISLKYNIYKSLPKEFEFSIAAGAKLPLKTEPQIVNGVTLPVDLQASSGNFGMVLQSFLVKQYPEKSLRLFLINRYEKHFNENKQAYVFGDAIASSFFVSRHLWFPWTSLTEDFTAILQIRHEFKKPNDRFSQKVKASGSNLVFVSPQLNYNFSELWNLSAIVDIPLYQYYNGIQLSNKYGFSISLSRDFGLEH
ncbi:MAG: hypothetical protein PHT69_14860 [Bacteroidales bacterium]|nr:hypothetical protein [Bacteroidales bacterium]